MSGLDVLVLQGANMTFLGRRLPHLYGTTTAAELDRIIEDRAADLGLGIRTVYTHVEGHAIEAVYRAVDDGARGLLMNPAGFLYAGWALRDTIEAVRDACGIRYVEVHMTNIDRRGKTSVLADQADAVVTGLGVRSYIAGLDGLAVLLRR